MKTIIKKLLKKFGFQIQKFPDIDIRRRIFLVKKNNINKIIDVGANIGQYAIGMREAGFVGEIISFEPLYDVFLKLKNNAEKERKWQVYNYAIGREDGDAVINIAKNSISSSINNMQEAHLKAAPGSLYIGKEKILIKKLDSLFDSFYENNDRVMLKIDTQGFEKNVIDGAEKSLDKIVLLQLEMSLISLYENEMLFSEMLEYLKERNFQLMYLENGFYDERNGQLLQVDGIFINKNKIIN